MNFISLLCNARRGRILFYEIEIHAKVVNEDYKSKAFREGFSGVF